MHHVLAQETQATNTLADYWRAANIEPPVGWAESLRLARTPFKHQITGLNLLAVHPRAGLYDDPGLGKTLIAQAHILWLVSLGNKAVCAMPPVLVKQFRDSFHSNFPGIERHVRIETFQGDIEDRDELIAHWETNGWPDVLIMSFDMFAGKSPTEILSLVNKRRKAIETRTKVLEAWDLGGWQAVQEVLPNKFRDASEEEVPALFEKWVKALRKKYEGKSEPADKLSPADEANQATWLAKGYNHLTLDEATAIKTPGSDLHKAVKQFAGDPGAETNGLTLITGSPVENNLTDLYGLVKLITPSRYLSFRAFERIHCIYTLGRFPKLIGFQNEDFAYQSLYLQGRRVTKKEALDLPPRLITELRIELAKKHRDLYETLVRERVLEIGEKVIDATTASSLYVKSQRILVCPELFVEEGWKTENTLITALDELIHSLGGRKLLLFAWFSESVRKLAMRYSHLNPATLYGEVTGADRERQKAKFIDDPTCKLMIANPRSGGVGVDGLQGVCSHAAFIEPIGVPGLMEQAVSRLHRTGQKAEAINIYLFTAMHTVAVTLRNNLVRKESEANKVVRDSKVLLGELMGSGGIEGSLD
jgi:SNF2 family DNA or RNA helicase